ncbi:MAG: hypothetical protein IKV41_07190 [Oscillospiraceae bacterium]|nr:hypothetical protein [Oscillospiraceae bacterium]
MENLWEETISALEENGKTFEDVRWIGSVDAQISIDDFKELSNVYYNSGHGVQEVAKDLVICGDDWWLEREECYGSQWWAFKKLPTKPNKFLKPTRLLCNAWEIEDTLVEICKLDGIEAYEV